MPVEQAARTMQRTSASVRGMLHGWRPEEDGGGTGSQSPPSLRHSTSGPRKCGDGSTVAGFSAGLSTRRDSERRLLILVISVTFSRNMGGRLLAAG